ncbi:MAG TPA: hypothetical protein VI612_03340 [Candidatus Nanoarchaeia archaeon]|nr:hypothetical protein [Candidatus Nanoarchaeia archaeon]
MSEYIWGAFVVIAIIAFSIGGAATILKFMESKKECNLNSDCNSESYCGSDFKCHTYPTIEKTIVKNDWITPAAILGLAIVLAAMIMRRKQERPRQFY